MESDSSQPGTPAGGPLQALNHDRVNQQRDSSSSVHDKISQFNNLSVSVQSKQLERKTADAALKRAMLGREEAELELRKYRDENKGLRKAVEEGKERERRVGERLETVMENYGRAKETHAHTQTLWEKEIRRYRKDAFKTQSANVKLQEELKTARSAVKILEESLEREKERSHAHEQEAFTARYQIVGVQEKLDEALGRIKVVEQERDAYKTAAKNEEVARIAAEGRIPLPEAQDPNDEFASPTKKGQKKRKISGGESRYSLSTMEIESSVAAEMEIEELNSQVQWERQRAGRAQEMVEFLEAECRMQCCPCGRPKPRASFTLQSRQSQGPVIESAELITEPRIDDLAEEEPAQQVQEVEEEEASVHGEEMQDVDHSTSRPQLQTQSDLVPPKSRKEPRRSTIFCPNEGIFRTVSEQEAEALEAEKEAEVVSKDVRAEDNSEPPTPIEAEESETETEPEPEPDAGAETETSLRMYARTPSVDPPAFALLGQERTSLLSLLNAPHGDAHQTPVPRIPMVPDPPPGTNNGEERRDDDDNEHQRYDLKPQEAAEVLESPEPRPHTSATLYKTVTTTVPVRDEDSQRESSSSSSSEKPRTPSSHSSSRSFDATNPALTPTMTREQALAKIRERRGRARSAANGPATPHKKMVQGKDRRDMSAPTGKVGGKTRS